MVMAPVASVITRKRGRKLTMLCAGLLFLAGAILNAAAQDLVRAPACLPAFVCRGVPICLPSRQALGPVGPHARAAAGPGRAARRSSPAAPSLLPSILPSPPPLPARRPC